jgi:hypothetical protein
LHEDPNPDAVDPNIGFDVDGWLQDGVEVDAEQLGAPLQRIRARRVRVRSCASQACMPGRE